MSMDFDDIEQELRARGVGGSYVKLEAGGSIRFAFLGSKRVVTKPPFKEGEKERTEIQFDVLDLDTGEAKIWGAGVRTYKAVKTQFETIAKRKKEPLDFSFTLTRTGTGTQTQYALSKDDELTADEHAKVAAAAIPPAAIATEDDDVPTFG